MEHKSVTSVKVEEMIEWYDQATCRCQGWSSRKLAEMCTYCGKVGLEEDTCFKEKAKEGDRQRSIVCYNHDKPSQRWCLLGVLLGTVYSIP